MHETRLNIRLQGALADHVNRQIEEDIYDSYSAYIRDLVRRDMLSEKEEDIKLEDTIERGLDDIKKGRYKKWNGKKNLEQNIKYAKSRYKK